MISVVAVNPSKSALRGLSNQLWDSKDELILVLEPGSEGEVALRATQEVFGELRITVMERPLTWTMFWDSYPPAFGAAGNDWIWSLPLDVVPAPTALETIRAGLSADSGAKIHLFRAFGPGNVLMPAFRGDSALLGPKTITMSCAVVPKGLAKLATFGSNEWGDAFWLAEMHRLHISGEEALVWHNKLVSLRDTERPIRERRAKAGEKIRVVSSFESKTQWKGWSIFPAIDSSSEPAATVLVGDADEGRIHLLPEWQGRGLYVSLVQFLLEARAGESTSVRVSDVTEGERVALEGAGFTLHGDTAVHAGLCARW